MASYDFEDILPTDVLIRGDEVTFAAGVRIGQVEVEFLAGTSEIEITVGSVSVQIAEADAQDVQFLFADDADRRLFVLTSRDDAPPTGSGGTADDEWVAWLLAGDDELDASNQAGKFWFHGGDGSDTITGGDQGDHIWGSAQRGTDPSLDDGDSIDGGGGNDYIHGNGGDDTLIGGDGRDRIFGGRGSDSIDGGEHNDTLFGGLSDDTLVGGAAYDEMTGGDGEDVFYFRAGDALFEETRRGSIAADVITDFERGDDALKIAGFDPTTDDLVQLSSRSSISAMITAAQRASDALDDSAPPTIFFSRSGDNLLIFYSGSQDGEIDSIIMLNDTSTIDLSDFHIGGRLDGRTPITGNGRLTGTSADDIIEADGNGTATLVGNEGADELYGSTGAAVAEQFWFASSDARAEIGDNYDTIFNFGSEDSILIEPAVGSFSVVDDSYADLDAAFADYALIGLANTLIAAQIGDDLYLIYSDNGDDEVPNAIIRMVDYDYVDSSFISALI